MLLWMWRAKCSISGRLSLIMDSWGRRREGMNFGMLKISVLSKMPGLISCH